MLLCWSRGLRLGRGEPAVQRRGGRSQASRARRGYPSRRVTFAASARRPTARPPLGLSGQVRCPASSSVPLSPCRQFRARATRPRTTSGGSPGVLAMCHSVGSSYSACPRSGDPTLGSPPASIRRHEPGAQPSRFSTIPRVLGETRWPFSSFPSVRSVTPVASAKAHLSRHRLRDHPYPKKIEESSSPARGYRQRSASLFSAHLIHALYFLSVLP